MIRDEFPHVTVEACSGGGGRIDRSVLGVSDLVWTSDQTGPRDRLAIQDGFLRTYPASVMCSWVTDMTDDRDLTPCSDHFRCLVAFAGVMGVGADLRAIDPRGPKSSVTGSRPIGNGDTSSSAAPSPGMERPRMSGTHWSTGSRTSRSSSGSRARAPARRASPWVPRRISTGAGR